MKKRFAILLLLFSSCMCTQAQTYKYDFGEGAAAPGYVKVTPGNVYSDDAGFGFDLHSQVQAVRNASRNKMQDDYITSSAPFYFSVKLPEGNYNVKVIAGDAKGASVTTIKAECRRLMVEKVVTKKGAFVTCAFTVHVHDSVIRGNEPSVVKLKPREHNYLHWDNKLTLEFNNSAAKICAVEISRDEKIPTIFLAGNSTVVDQSEEPWASWGQMFPVFLQAGKVAVANYAESGETLLAFKRENRLAKIWSMAKPGDYLLMEFAHNDQKPGGNHLDAATTYKQTLKEWIAESRKHGMTPVLVTSTNRRSFDSTTGKIINTLEGFPGAMREVGKEENVTVLDLNAMSKTLYEAWGVEGSVKGFVHYAANTFPGQTKELKDNTHFNCYGAYELAKCIVQAIRESRLPIKDFIEPGFKTFDPAKPDDAAAFSLPLSLFSGSVKPDGN